MTEKWGGNDVGRALLFDRLVDENPYQKSEKTPSRGYDMEGLYASVRRELLRLLNTRCPVSGDVALGRERTVIDYGLPDLAWGGRATIVEDSRRLERLIRHTIEAFEPRLRNVDITIEKVIDGGARLVVSIDGVLTTENVREPLSFSLPIGGGDEEDAGGS